MQFLLLVFINIVIAAVFYLILRLRLEKYATDYREKRLKKEMDQIINDFNETAERNITILENRIDILKKLMEKSGMKEVIDFRINNEKAEPVEHKIKPNNIKIENKIENSQTIFKKFKEKIHSITSESENNKKILINSRQSFETKQSDAIESEITVKPDGEKEVEIIENIDIKIQNNDLEKILIQREDDSYFSKDRIQEMFNESDDKYKLIATLYNDGYTAEFISECSSIPIGEINLVLDLNTNI